LILKATNNTTSESTLRTQYSLDSADFTIDGSSVIYTNGAERFRLPKTSVNYDSPLLAAIQEDFARLLQSEIYFKRTEHFMRFPVLTPAVLEKSDQLARITNELAISHRGTDYL
jgi:hypothetical protein